MTQVQQKQEVTEEILARMLAGTKALCDQAAANPHTRFMTAMLCNFLPEQIVIMCTHWSLDAKAVQKKADELQEQITQLLKDTACGCCGQCDSEGGCQG